MVRVSINVLYLVMFIILDLYARISDITFKHYIKFMGNVVLYFVLFFVCIFFDGFFWLIFIELGLVFKCVL